MRALCGAKVYDPLGASGLDAVGLGGWRSDGEE